jgi:hypothetical protein
MRPAKAALCVALLLVAAGANASAGSLRAAGPGSPIALTQDEYAHLGAVTERARAVNYTPQVHGYGTVLSTATFAQMDADIESAQAAVLQSQASFERYRKLHHAANAVSMEALDVVQHQATADSVALALADRKESSAFGATAPWRGPPRDSDLIAKVVSGANVIVQATFPLDTRFGTAPLSFSIEHLSEQHAPVSSGTGVIWRAPADPTIPGQSFFTIIDAHDLEEGEHVVVYAPTGPAVAGARIPAEAVVIAAQQAWCYVLEAPLTFRRVSVDMSRPLDGGYFVTSGVKPNQPVLVKGTGLLLAREFGPTGYGPD